MKNIVSGSVGRVNIVGATMRYAMVGVMEGEIGQDLMHLHTLGEVMVDVPSPVDRLLGIWTADNLTGGLPIKEGALLFPPAIT